MTFSIRHPTGMRIHRRQRKDRSWVEIKRIDWKTSGGQIQDTDQITQSISRKTSWHHLSLKPSIVRWDLNSWVLDYIPQGFYSYQEMTSTNPVRCLTLSYSPQRSKQVFLSLWIMVVSFIIPSSVKQTRAHPNTVLPSLQSGKWQGLCVTSSLRDGCSSNLEAL